MLDFSKKRIGEPINGNDLNDYCSILHSDDIILLYTGISDYWNENNNKKIGTRFIYLESSGADWVVGHKIKTVGIDTFSLEKFRSKEGLTHKKLLTAGIGIIENLNSNLKKFVGRRVFCVCLPLALMQLDASPARIVVFDILEE